MNVPENRCKLGTWLNMMQLTGEGAEIGVAYGGFSRLILDSWSGKMLHMVDMWERQDPSVYKESTNQEANFQQWHEQARGVAGYYKRARLWQGDSIDVAGRFSDGELDFVYIDANHDGDAVKADLSAWWPKVKLGGIVGGHDFLTKHDEGWWCDVESAVTDWARERNLPFTVTPCSSFWIPKL